MRDAVMGVLIGAGAVILASWYLTRTHGQLLPAGLADALALPSSDDCGCSGGGRGYQARAVRSPTAPPVTFGEFQ